MVGSYKYCLEQMRLDLVGREGFTVPNVVPNSCIIFNYSDDSDVIFFIAVFEDGSYKICLDGQTLHWGNWVEYVDVDECDFEDFVEHIEDHYEEFLETGSVMPDEPIEESANPKFESGKSVVEVKAAEIPWDGQPSIGWWEDNNPLCLYHGTHIKYVDSVLEHGIDRKDPDTGLISLSLDPNTANEYAAMSGAGGEREYKNSGGELTPPEQRAIFKFEIPMSWVKEHYDDSLPGNVGQAYSHITDKESYQEFSGTDSEFYALAELQFDEVIPPEYIVGYMIPE